MIVPQAIDLKSKLNKVFSNMHNLAMLKLPSKIDLPNHHQCILQLLDEDAHNLSHLSYIYILCVFIILALQSS